MLHDVYDKDDKISIKYFLPPLSPIQSDKLYFVKSVGETHIKLWSNNSMVTKRKLYKLKGKSVFEVKLHLIFENIFMQILSFSEGEQIFEIIYLFEPDSVEKNLVLKKLRRKECI